MVWLVAALMLMLGYSSQAAAQFATSGTGTYRDSIFWVDFGNNGENVFAGRTVTRSFNVGSPATAANLLAITCTLSDATAVSGSAGLAVYTPGSWQGDGLDELYNIGGNHPGTGANPNTLSIGLRTNSAATIEFTLSCSATLGGNPFPLNGLVFADAESSATPEYVAARPTSGTLRVIDQITACGAATSVSVSGSEVRFTGPVTGCQNNGNTALRAGPALVGFIEGATSARIIASGGGISAVAVGAMVDLEFSEAVPATYGVASHILSPVWTGGVATTGINYHDPANLAMRSFGVRLGTNLLADQNANGSIDGPDVDALPTRSGAVGGGYADTAAPSGAPGTPYSISNVVCRGPASVAGWIDFNANGTYEAGERSATATCPSGTGSVTLTWALPADFTPRATSHMRLRLATDPADIAGPTGVAKDGETEDYRLELAPAYLTLAKTVDNAGGGTADADDFTLSASGPTPISGASGSTAVTAAPVNIGTYTLSETNLPFYVSSGYSCSINGGAAVAGDQVTLAEGDEAVCAVTNSFSPISIGVAKSADPGEGATVSIGQTIEYTVTVTVAGGATTQQLTISDTLGAGLAFGAVTDAGAFSCAGSLTCTLAAGTAPGTYALSYTATVAAGATGTIANSVTATNPVGGDPDPTCATCTVSHQVLPAYNFCAADEPIYNIINGVNIWRFTPPGGPEAHVPQLSTPVANNLNGLMLDPVRNRLLFIQRATSTQSVLWAYDAANGGWYQAAGPFTSPDFPRAAMNHLGVGFLVAGGSNSPDVWRVTASGTFGYVVERLGSLSYDVNPTDVNSGDIAFDASGVAWLAAGEDLYTVDLTAGSLAAIRRAKPLLNGSPSTISWAGIAFGSDGRLYVANNSASGSYHAYDPATGILVQAASLSAGGARDLASCFFPTIAEPELSVSKALAEVNGAAYVPGAPVYPTDTLTYRITVSNSGGAVGTLFAGDVDETLPANTSFVATGNDFTCSGSNCSNGAAVNVPANGSATLDFVVRVNSPLTGAVATIDNAVTVAGVDCAAAGNDCTESTPVGPLVSVGKTANPVSGSSVAAGQTITYTVTVAVSNAPTTQAVTLVDTLDPGLTFGSVTNAGSFNCSASLTCELAAGAAPGTYELTYTATVDADAVGTVGNSVVATNPAGGDPDPTCTTCATEHQISPASISVVKSADPATGSVVAPGSTINYTLTVTVANSATTETLTLTDTLDAGLTFGSVTSPGAFTCSGALSCELAAGAVPGTYALTYSAAVDSDATGTVGNVVAATNPPGGDPDPVCTTCATEHQVTPAAVSVVKTSDPATGAIVLPGSTINYTLTVTVANSSTTQAVTLTDTLGPDLEFGSVTDPGVFSCAGSLACELPAGTAPGSYALTYSATVADDATGTIGNVVTATNPPDGDPDPVCTTCTTEHQVTPPAVGVVKTADPANGATVAPGDTINYTLTVTVANSATTEALTLTDTLDAGLTFGSVTNAGAFNCSGLLTCELAAGALPGTYALTYSATVDEGATGTVGNTVAATNPPGGDPDPTCTTCRTEHQITPASISVVKSADPTTGSVVAPGNTITYTLTVTVANSATTQALTLSDTPGPGLTFGSVVNPGPFNCSGTLTCVLPAGVLPGSYAIVYNATVDADATGSIGNVVTATNPPGGDPDPVCTTCTTEHQVIQAGIAVAKTASPGNGASVLPGSTIDYTLTVTVTNSATTQPLTLTDTLDPDLTFGSVTSAGAFDCSGTLTCVLPEGALPGTYAVTYSATVDEDATGTVGNSVVASNPPGGDEDPVCTTCTTEHEITPAGVSVVKSADPSNGATVLPGSTINYTLTVTVTNSATTQAVTLTDTLGSGLSFGEVTSAGAFSCSAALTCVLPAGTLPGTYALTYSATVDADATGTVGNVVTATNPPGGDPDPVCATCSTGHEITATAITVAKTSDPDNGETVLPGSTINYTLTVTVANSATTQALTLNDTLGSGLTFGAVSSPGAFSCLGSLTCLLPAGTLPGTYALTYSATVDDDATGNVGNVVTATNPPDGDPDPVCATCTTGHQVTPTSVTVAKTASPGAGTTVAPGDTINYTLTVTVANSATTQDVTLVDTLGAGLTFGSVTAPGPFNCSASLTCVLPAGTLPGVYAVSYSALVDAGATGTVGNVVVATNPPDGDPDPVCTACTTEHPIVATAVSIVKTAAPGDGATVSPGDTITYTLTATVANSATTEAVTLTDTPGDGLAFGAVTNSGSFVCSGSLSCQLPAGTLPGTYAMTYTATVAADATGSVGNAVTGTNPPGGDPDPVCTTCTTEHRIVATAVTVSKTSDPGSGATVSPGDTISYRLNVTVANSATTQAVTLNDTLGDGLTFGSVTNSGVLSCSGSLTCQLPAGTLPGTYTVVYTASVDADATGALGNVVTASKPDGGDPEPVCTTCTTEHRVMESRVVVAKTSAPGAGAEVRAGDLIAYTLTATVENSATTQVVTLTDTLGQGLTFGSVTDSGVFACSGSLTCELPAGTLPGTYKVTYTASVDANATGVVANAVAATNPEGGDPEPVCGTCSVEHRVMDARVRLAKSATPGNGAEVHVGDTIDYRLTVTVENSATTAPVMLTDTPDPGLTIGALPADCTQAGGAISCVLPAGTVPGTYDLVYPATVNADANGDVGNAVAGSYAGGTGEVECTNCQTAHKLVDKASLRILKSAASRAVRIGDLVRYTVTVENVGALNVSGAVIVDTPPAGFTYVADSMSVRDRDGAFALTGNHPLRIGGVDIAAGDEATIVYMLRVGAGVGSGTHVNEAVAYAANGVVASNVATAQVTIDSDPLLEDSLIFGSVFDDRDGDGWQDKADLSGLRIVGGFDPSAYVAASTTLDRGAGPQPVADASAPLVRGLDLGSLSGKQTLVISQRLTSLAFAELVLTSGQGITVRMDPSGRVTTERAGEAAKGLTAADPTIERRIARVDGGWEVAYIISNAGVAERGIAGVRVASVEGLLIETDQYGRYHLVDVPGGADRGRNFILKVDPATLPRGSAFTTRNPLVRRITPGIPVRFDFGVRLPAEATPAGATQLELGAALFEPEGAALRADVAAAVEQIAQRIAAGHGGELLVAASPGGEALTFDRAVAVRDALSKRLDPLHAQALKVSVRSDLDDPRSFLAGTHGERLVFGDRIFDAAGAPMPGHAPLIDVVVRRLEARGGGTIVASDPPPDRLFEIIARLVSPQVRSRLRIESGPAVPATGGE